MAKRLLVISTAWLLLLGCGETPTSNHQVFDPHPVGGPPYPDSDITITVDGSEFTAPTTVTFTFHNASTRPLMYWPQCQPAYEVWQADKWVVPPQICYYFWRGIELGPGESFRGEFEFTQRGAFRAVLPFSIGATGPWKAYRSNWWIVR